MVAVPCRDRSVRLHHGVALVRRRVDFIERHRRCRKCALEVADTLERRHIVAVVARGPCIRGLSGEIEPSGTLSVLDTNQVRCSASLLECLGHNDRDCLMVVLNLRSAEQIGVIHAPSAEPRHIQRRNNC